MDLGKFIGKKLVDAKEELENLGFSVIVKNNANKSNDSSISLVVRAKLLREKEIELVIGDFTFLS